MTKPTITKLWIVGLILLAVGLLAGGISLGLMLAYGGHWLPALSGNGYDFVPTYDAFFWAMVGIMIAGFTLAVVGAVMQVAAWVGALINSYQLQDKTWFVVLLVGGVMGLAFGLIGFAVMVAYLVAGPDAMAIRPPQMPPEQPPQTVVPTP